MQYMIYGLVATVFLFFFSVGVLSFFFLLYDAVKARKCAPESDSSPWQTNIPPY